jgi:hypothetical protein
MLRSGIQAGNGYDWVILDADMSELDAARLMTAIREESLVSAAALVILTRLGQNADGLGFSVKANCTFLTKPVRRRLLYGCLAGLYRPKPREALAGPGETPVDREAPKRLQARVLLVEDNEVNQWVAAAMLENLGCKVHLADNGRKALEALSTGCFDLILMDVQMPVMDGYEATRVIREQETKGCGKHPRIPIVALTANAMEVDRQACLEAGMDDFLSKPFTLDSLHGVLDRWLSFQGESSPHVKAENDFNTR